MAAKLISHQNLKRALQSAERYFALMCEKEYFQRQRNGKRSAPFFSNVLQFRWKAKLIEPCKALSYDGAFASLLLALPPLCRSQLLFLIFKTLLRGRAWIIRGGYCLDATSSWKSNDSRANEWLPASRFCFDSANPTHCE